MDISYAKRLLETLADGVNLLTGEILAQNDSCNQVEIVRAIYALLAAVPDEKTKSVCENAGKPWTTEDDDLLCRMFDEGKTRKEICEYFKRSSGAIASRLMRLGKIKNRDAYERH